MLCWGLPQWDAATLRLTAAMLGEAHIGWRGDRQRCFQIPRFETNFLTSMTPDSAALEIDVAALNVGTPVAKSPD